MSPQLLHNFPATREEVIRACRYASKGFDDAEPAEAGDADPRRRADTSAAARNLANLEERIVAVCVALGRPPDALMCETQSRLDAMRAAAAVELGKTLSKDEARLQADYDLTLREITQRLNTERPPFPAAGITVGGPPFPAAGIIAGGPPSPSAGINVGGPPSPAAEIKAGAAPSK